MALLNATSQACAQAALDAQGFLVVCKLGSKPLTVGEVIDVRLAGKKIGVALVKATATKEEFLDQFRKYAPADANFTQSLIDAENPGAQFFKVIAE